MKLGALKKVINTLKYHSQKNPNNTKSWKLNYTIFRNNRHRMQYALVLKSNYPIGSGVTTKATCKTLVTQRMKCAGMRWEYKWGARGFNKQLQFSTKRTI